MSTPYQFTITPFYLLTPEPAPKDLSSVDNGRLADTNTFRIATLSDLFAESCELYTSQSLRPHLDCIASIAVPLLPQIERGPLETSMSAPKAESVTNESKSPTATDGPRDATHTAPVVISKPDRVAYEAEQQRIRAEIDLVQGNLVRHHVECFAIENSILLHRMR